MKTRNTKLTIDSIFLFIYCYLHIWVTVETNYPCDNNCLLYLSQVLVDAGMFVLRHKPRAPPQFFYVYIGHFRAAT